MPFQAYTYRMPVGFAGDVNRVEVAHIEANILDTTVSVPTAFGVPMKFGAAGKVAPIALAGDTAALVIGFNVREYPSQGPVNDPLGTSTPPTSGLVSILKRGYILVSLGGVAAAVKGGTVYIRVATPSAGKPLGGVEAASDTTNTVALPVNSYFMGPADANGVTEIAFNI